MNYNKKAVHHEVNFYLLAKMHKSVIIPLYTMYIATNPQLVYHKNYKNLHPPAWPGDLKRIPCLLDSVQLNWWVANSWFSRLYEDTGSWQPNPRIATNIDCSRRRVLVRRGLGPWWPRFTIYKQVNNKRGKNQIMYNNGLRSSNIHSYNPHV